jgi:endonuclease G
MKTRCSVVIAGAFVAVFLCGCASTKPEWTYGKAVHTEYGKQAGLSPTESRWIAAICPLGIPKKQAGVDFGPTRLIVREGYVLEHSATEKIPLWVCEAVTSAQVTGPLNRPKPEPFAPDPKLEKGRRAELSDYRKSGYDRGHQAPSANQTVSQQLQAETYFLSNMAPQTEALNQRIWKSLEARARELARTNGPAYIITGPLFYDEAEDDSRTADGYVEHMVIGKDVAVPTHFYKVILWRNASNKWVGTAVVMKNQKKPFPKPYHFDNYVRSIEWVEERTGLDFNPELPGQDVGRVERTSNPVWN